MDAHCLKPDDLPDLKIETLGPCKIDSPLISLGSHFVDDDEKVVKSLQRILDLDEQMNYLVHTAHDISSTLKLA